MKAAGNRQQAGAHLPEPASGGPSPDGERGAIPSLCGLSCALGVSDPDDAVFTRVFDEHWRQREEGSRLLWCMVLAVPAFAVVMAVVLWTLNKVVALGAGSSVNSVPLW